MTASTRAVPDTAGDVCPVPPSTRSAGFPNQARRKAPDSVLTGLEHRLPRLVPGAFLGFDDHAGAFIDTLSQPQASRTTVTHGGAPK
ncbi:hypothetical protein [Streptomyces sp. NPDC058964]|uniref:hypothetical protein n=1 Tax=Streptomyces sp. NPDC058964 TaxID=3346681 RepID=UPI003698315B